MFIVRFVCVLLVYCPGWFSEYLPTVCRWFSTICKVMLLCIFSHLVRVFYYLKRTMMFVCCVRLGDYNLRVICKFCLDVVNLCRNAHRFSNFLCVCVCACVCAELYENVNLIKIKCIRNKENNCHFIDFDNNPANSWLELITFLFNLTIITHCYIRS